MAETDWRQPFQQNFMQRAQDVGGSQYTPFGGSTTAAANPMQQQSWQNTFNRGLQGAPEVSAARSQMTDTINGGGFQSNPYLSQQNPYLQNTIDSTLGDITRNYNLTTKPAMTTANVRSGSFGNSGLQEMQVEQERGLAQELGRASSNLRFGDYQQQAQMYGQERDRQMQATQNAPNFANVDYTDLQAMQQAGNSLQGQQQNELTSNFNQYLDSREWPFKTFGAQGQAMGVGGGQAAQTYPQANRGANVLGGALAGAQVGSSIGSGNAGWGALAGGLLGFL
jgi:hypothetical protein